MKIIVITDTSGGPVPPSISPPTTAGSGGPPDSLGNR